MSAINIRVFVSSNDVTEAEARADAQHLANRLGRTVEVATNQRIRADDQRQRGRGIAKRIILVHPQQPGEPVPSVVRPDPERLLLAEVGNTLYNIGTNKSVLTERDRTVIKGLSERFDKRMKDR